MASDRKLKGQVFQPMTTQVTTVQPMTGQLSTVIKPQVSIILGYAIERELAKSHGGWKSNTVAEVLPESQIEDCCADDATGTDSYGRVITFGSSSGCTVSARDILWYLVFTGFVVNYMVRLNINIGIVSMVKSIPKSSNVSNSSACIQTVVSNSFINSTVSVTHIADESRFVWDEKQQGLVLGAFFWFYWLTQVPGGMLAQRYGTKLIFGLSNAVPCILACLIPLCARLDFSVLVFLRALQGFIAGLSWPSMHHLAANWIPPNERSKFVTAYMGSSVGAAITYPFCGLLINWFNWPSVFYATGAIGTLWFTCWWLLVFDSPAKHPRISETEKKDILKKLGQTVNRQRLPTPWKKILLSRPMWMNVMTQWGNVWGLFTLMTQSPTYFKYIHGWDIRMAGFLSGIPHLARVGFAILVSFTGDYLLKKNTIPRTNVRKLATVLCCIGQGLFTLGLAFSGCNSTVAIVSLTLATGMSGAVSTGALASFIDIGPNFASIMLGISNMVSVVPGFISPIIVGHLTYKNQTVGQWQLVFIIATINLLVPGILYQFFSSSDLQPWNSPEEENHNEELQKLHSQQNKDDIIIKDAPPYMMQKETNLKTAE